MALNKLVLNKDRHRLVTVRATGRRHIVIHHDHSRGVWQVWAAVDGYADKYLRVNGSLSLRDEDVRPPQDKMGVALTRDLAVKLFGQYELDHPGRSEGTHEVKTTKGFTSVQVYANYGDPHETLTCPMCNTQMRRRRLPSGGIFVGCKNFKSTGCKITFSATGDKIGDPDGVLPPGYKDHYNKRSKGLRLAG